MSMLKLKPKITSLTETEKKRLIIWLENDLKQAYKNREVTRLYGRRLKNN